MPKTATFLLVNLIVYGNQGKTVSRPGCQVIACIEIINKTLILKDSCKFGINYEWDDDKTR